MKDSTLYALERTGKPPLDFTGKMIRKALGDPKEVRWHELRIYRTEGGKYVLDISYHSDHVAHRTGKDPDYHEVTVHDSISTLQDALRSHETWIADSSVPYPLGVPNRETKRQKYVDSIMHRYKEQVSKLLDSPEFAEVVK